MEKIVWKGSFAEAEEKDDIYWANQSMQQRLEALIDLRDVFFSDANPSIEKVVFKRKLDEESETEA
ncbi:hypothetical protein F0919_12790 [Taibaiella lutea]|uniref:Uncharacterized protein n=1 Tax=Taibaiella lutea TaxID=2608001 RepID=A0A5M6CHK3_9BACT|nr:hypothetical protein [Taibaiella lutea]KAA5533412.1 hypothetical protein F0919_12790 [Taibaiella lutea]